MFDNCVFNVLFYFKNPQKSFNDFFKIFNSFYKNKIKTFFGNIFYVVHINISLVFENINMM